MDTATHRRHRDGFQSLAWHRVPDQVLGDDDAILADLDSSPSREEEEVRVAQQHQGRHAQRRGEPLLGEG
jgi:hypothetical protein